MGTSAVLLYIVRADVHEVQSSEAGAVLKQREVAAASSSVVGGSEWGTIQAKGAILVLRSG